MNSATKIIGILAVVLVASFLVLSLARAQKAPESAQVQTACQADRAQQGCGQAKACADQDQTACCPCSGAKDTIACDPDQKAECSAQQTACCAQKTADQPQ